MWFIALVHILCLFVVKDVSKILINSKSAVIREFFRRVNFTICLWHGWGCVQIYFAFIQFQVQPYKHPSGASKFTYKARMAKFFGKPGAQIVNKLV